MDHPIPVTSIIVVVTIRSNAKVSMNAISIVKTEPTALRVALTDDTSKICETSCARYTAKRQSTVSKSTGKKMRIAAMIPYQPIHVFIIPIYPRTDKKTSDIADPTTGTKFPIRYLPVFTAKLSLPVATKVCSDIIPTNTVRDNPNVLVTQVLKVSATVFILKSGLIPATILTARYIESSGRRMFEDTPDIT